MTIGVELKAGISFAPSSEIEEIVQNVRTIVATRLGTVPLDRDFGLTWEHIDKPIDVAKSLTTAEVISLIEKYEPRAKVQSVSFSNSEAGEGVLPTKIEIEIGGEND